MSHAYKTNNSYFSNNWYVHTYIYVYIHLYRNTYFTIVLFPWKHIWTIHITTQQTLWKTIYGTFFCISFSTWFSICKITTQFFIVFTKLENYENLISGILFLIVQLELSSIKNVLIIIIILLAILLVIYKYIKICIEDATFEAIARFKRCFKSSYFRRAGFMMVTNRLQMDVVPRFRDELCFRTRNIYNIFDDSSWRSRVVQSHSKLRCRTSLRFDLPECCVDSGASRNRNHTSNVICRYYYFFLFILMENPLLGKYPQFALQSLRRSRYYCK